MEPYERMTPAIAEAIGAVTAELMQVMFDAGSKHPELEWTDLVVAAASAMRGLAARARHIDPSLTEGAATTILFGQFLAVLALPSELIKIVGDGGVPDKAGFIPVRRQ